MRKILLASAGVMVMSAGTGYAACIPTPSCSSLGYESSSSCEGGIKCPFGNAWNCTVINKVNEITNKVTELEKVIEESGIGGGSGDTSNCVIGSIFYSDWSCSYGRLIQGKIPIGVVVQSDNAGHGQAMALNSVALMTWGGYRTDIPGLNNFTSASTDLKSCENTAVITAAGTSSTYPAAWAAHEYKIEGTNAGDWCLPAAGIMTSIKNNMSTIDNGFNLAGGAQIETSSDYWSSTEVDSGYAWASYFSYEYGLYSYYSSIDSRNYYRTKQSSHEVRPVLEF